MGWDVRSMECGHAARLGVRQNGPLAGRKPGGRSAFMEALLGAGHGASWFSPTLGWL